MNYLGEGPVSEFSFGILPTPLKASRLASLRRSLGMTSPGNYINLSQASLDLSLSKQLLRRSLERKLAQPQSIYAFSQQVIDEAIQDQEAMDSQKTRSIQENQNRKQQHKDREKVLQQTTYKKDIVSEKGRECEGLFSQINHNLDQLEEIGHHLQQERRDSRVGVIRKRVHKHEVVSFMKTKLLIMAESIVQFQLRQKHDKQLDFYSFALKNILNEEKEGEDSQDEDNKYQCKFCGQRFKQGCALGGHISKMHKGVSYEYRVRQKRREMRDGERLRNKFIQRYVQHHSNK